MPYDVSVSVVPASLTFDNHLDFVHAADDLMQRLARDRCLMLGPSIRSGRHEHLTLRVPFGDVEFTITIDGRPR